jgi:3-hydroxyisobutyrate dehydrogenase-like beta-hydroxyacid dehydrogenase
MSKATTADNPWIGSIGLGKMGLPSCERLAAQQFKLTTLTRNPEGRERADRAKLRGEPKIGDVVAGAQIVVAMGRKGGLGNAEMMDVICQSAVASPLLQYKRDTVVNSAYDPAFAVKQIMKDFDLIAEVSRQDHCPIPLVAQVRQQYEAAFVNGCGDLDFFVLAREAARIAGL